jgi:hypothetical protein
MAAFTKLNFFVEDMGRKIHNLNSDVLKVMLTNTVPVATNHVYADVSGTELANGNGYLTGGTASGANTYVQTSGTAKLVASDVVFTASGSMGPFRYVILYNSTAASKNLIGWYDYTQSITLGAGDTFTVDFDAAAGVLTNV